VLPLVEEEVVAMLNNNHTMKINNQLLVPLLEVVANEEVVNEVVVNLEGEVLEEGVVLLVMDKFLVLLDLLHPKLEPVEVRLHLVEEEEVLVQAQHALLLHNNNSLHMMKKILLQYKLHHHVALRKEVLILWPV